MTDTFRLRPYQCGAKDNLVSDDLPAILPATGTILLDGLDHVAVWGPDEETTSEQSFTTFEEAHAFVLARKAEGAAVAFVDERPCRL